MEYCRLLKEYITFIYQCSVEGFPRAVDKWKKPAASEQKIMHTHSLHTVDVLFLKQTNKNSSCRTGVSKFLCKGPQSKIFKILQVKRSLSQLMNSSLRAWKKTDNFSTKEHGYLPTKFYLCTLKLEFHIIFMCQFFSTI